MRTEKYKSKNKKKDKDKKKKKIGITRNKTGGTIRRRKTRETRTTGTIMTKMWGSIEKTRRKLIIDIIIKKTTKLHKTITITTTITTTRTIMPIKITTTA